MNDYWQAVSSYRSPQLVHDLANAINDACQEMVTLMQVCGTHTWNYRRHGLATLITQDLSLIAGPGCPVCVIDQTDIDWVMELAQEKQNTLVTFGDLMRVPGSNGSLAELKSKGADVQVVLSPLEALDIAMMESSRRVIFVAMGFETTAPAVAATLRNAHQLGLANFSVALLLKQLMPTLRHIFTQGKPDGLLCPGHVAAILGQEAFTFLPQELHLPSAITGFEPVDMLLGLLALVHQLMTGDAQVTNTYPRVVTKQGNPIAKALIETTFTPASARWRGLGELPATGYQLIGALKKFSLTPPTYITPHATSSQCLCHLVILGKKTPTDCANFGNHCTPENPLGPCMVSPEGTCAAHYYYPDSISSLKEMR